MPDTAYTKKSKPLQKEGYHHGDLRAGLIEATRRLVEENGPEGFSVSDACRLAGVSTAAPYKHFKNKNEMLVAMIAEGMMRLRGEMAKAVADIPPGSALRIKAIGNEYVSFALKEPGVFRLKFSGHSEAMKDDHLRAAGEASFDFVLQEVALCLGAETITPEVRRRGFMLWSFVHGLSFILLDKDLTDMGGDLDLEDMLTDMAQRVLRDG